MTDVSPRLALPLLAAGQAQKELFHNEALIALEALVQPVAQSIGDNIPPAAPLPGRSWIVGTAPTGDWAGQAGAIAAWTGGGWRFAAPQEGMTFWIAAEGLWAQRAGGVWTVGTLPARKVAVGGQQVVGPRQPAIAAAAGGGTVDTQARATISAILNALAAHGLIASA